MANFDRGCDARRRVGFFCFNPSALAEMTCQVARLGEVAGLSLWVRAAN